MRIGSTFLTVAIFLTLCLVLMAAPGPTQKVDPAYKAVYDEWWRQMDANPWLDVKVSVMTEQKENMKALIGWIYTILCLPLAYVYIEWMQEDQRMQKEKGGKH